MSKGRGHDQTGVTGGRMRQQLGSAQSLQLKTLGMTTNTTQQAVLRRAGQRGFREKLWTACESMNAIPHAECHKQKQYYMQSTSVTTAE